MTGVEFDGTYRHPQRHGCPYERCSAVVMLMPTKPNPDADWTLMVSAHDISNRYLIGTCPASLMYHPLDDRARAHLARLSVSDGAKIADAIQAEVNAEVEEFTVSEKPKPRSQSLRGPHRLGREPVTPEEQEDWALGGREDEDIPQEPREDIPVKRPALGVLGHVMGRKAMSLSDIIGMNQQAALETGEGIGAIQEAQNELVIAQAKIGEALNTVAAMQGESGSVLLSEYFSMLQSVQTDLSSLHEQMDNIRSHIAAAQEKGIELVSRILGG